MRILLPIILCEYHNTSTKVQHVSRTAALLGEAEYKDKVPETGAPNAQSSMRVHRYYLCNVLRDVSKSEYATESGNAELREPGRDRWLRLALYGALLLPPLTFPSPTR